MPTESRRTLSPFFKLAFFTLLGLTLLFIASAVGFSVFIPNPTESQSASGENLWKAGTYTLTGLVGLMVGKVA